MCKPHEQCHYYGCALQRKQDAQKQDETLHQLVLHDYIRGKYSHLMNLKSVQK